MPLSKGIYYSPNVHPSASTDEEVAKTLARRKKMLESHDRDPEDMYLGFGSSRFDDAEDGEDTCNKLSVWGAMAMRGEARVRDEREIVC